MNPSIVVCLSLLASTALAEAPAPEAGPRRLAVGTDGYFQPGLLIQGWATGALDGDVTTAFRVRRLEIQGKGEILAGRLAYLFMLDPARMLEFQTAMVPAGMSTVSVRQPVGPTTLMQDAFVTVMSALADVSLGQFKIPVSWEGYGSSSRLLLPERALVARQFGDRRDIGIRATKSFVHFGYTAALFNGSGSNTPDGNPAKDVALRLEVLPVTGLMLGGVVYGTIGQRERPGAKDRFEVDVRGEWGPLLAQAEYIRGRDVVSTGTTRGQGLYAAAAVSVLPLQLVVRMGHLDPDTDRDLLPLSAGDPDEVWHAEAGLNWFLRGNEAKVQLAYGHYQFDDRRALDDLVLSAQVAY